MTSIPLAEARKTLGDLVDRVAYASERIELSKNGKPVAVVVTVEDAALLRQLEDKIDLEDARRALAEAKVKGTISLKDLKAELGL
jgi:prevent-host-death family protein